VGTLARSRHEYRVRFDEADAQGRLRPSGLLRYAQDMAWRHSEESGFPRAWYQARGLTWLVRNVRLALMTPIAYGDVLSVSTEVVGWRRLWARRRSEMRSIGSGSPEDDEHVAAVVETDWVLLAADGTPARVPLEITAAFAVRRSFRRERVDLPEPTGDVTTFMTRVRPLDVDPLGHMNNAAYLDVVDDGVSRVAPRERPVSLDHYLVDYVLPALPGTMLEVACWSAGSGRVGCRIRDATGPVLCRAMVSGPDR
jgi:acyl-ACP thioesterase